MPSSSSNELRVALTPGLLNFFHPGDMWPGPAPEIVLHRSTDLADSWKDSLVLSPVDGRGSDMPEIATFEQPGTGDPARRTTIGVLWRGEEFTGAAFSAGMALRLSYDNGMTWQPMTMVSDTPRGSFHVLAIEGNKVAAAWSHELGDFGPFRVKVRLSYDCGIIWDTVYNLTPTAQNAGDPSVTLSKSAVHVAWEEHIDKKWNIYYQRGELPKMTPLLSPPSLAFDTVSVGCSKSARVLINNVRCDPLYLTSHITNEQDYSVTPGVVIVHPHDSTALTIRYAPLSGGDKSTQLILTHNQGARPDTVLISAAAAGTGSELAITDTFGTGWRLLSLPVKTVCPFALRGSFFYQGLYSGTDTLYPGRGYWNKLDIPELSFAGTAVTEETVAVLTGWNMVGSISSALGVGDVQSIPGGVVASNFYGYDGSGYIVVDSIFPGRGYWVNVSQKASLIFSTAGGIPLASRLSIVPVDESPPPPPGGTVSAAQRQSPDQFSLEQNYPNPFNPTTSIRYSVGSSRHVSLTIYDVLGREIATLVSEVKQPGRYSVTWTPEYIASGIYFYRLTAGTFTETKKLLIVR